VSNFVFPTCSWSSLFGWSLSLCLSTCPMLIIYLFSVSVSSQFVGVRHNSPKLGPQRLKIWIKLCKSMSNYIHITKISHTLEKHIQKKTFPKCWIYGGNPQFSWFHDVEISVLPLKSREFSMNYPIFFMVKLGLPCPTQISREKQC
jgi:hypothetical protein